LSAFAAGLQAPAQLVEHSGTNDCVEIRLPPLSAFALLGGATTEFSRDPVNLLDLRPRPVGILLDELRATSSWHLRLAAVDRFLAGGFAQSKCRIPPQITRAWDVLERSHGQVPIHSLARAVGWSERHFIDQFRVYLGVRPKSTSRRLRFSHALNMISMHPDADLSMIAVQTGFSDQSHMTREIQTFSGLTPGVLRTARFADLPGIPAAALLTT
jgi:AraC-like DNA-binding protein